MRRTKEERSTHRTVMRKINSLQPASRKKAWGVADWNVGNDCSFRHRMQLAQTEINKHFVSIASRLSRGLNRSFACQKGIPFLNFVSAIMFLRFTWQFPGIGIVCTGGNLQMCKVQGLGNILPITHALYSTKFLLVLRRWTSPQPNVHAGDSYWFQQANFQPSERGFMWQSSNHFYHAFIPHMQNSVPRIRPTHRTYDHLIIRRTWKPNFGCTRAQPRNTRRHDRHNWVCFWQMSAQNTSFFGKTGPTRSM